MSHGRTAKSTGHRAIVAIAAAVVAATALDAQAPPSIDEIYVVQGSQRDPKAEGLLQAGWTGGARTLRVYRVPGSVEQLVRHYAKRLVARPDVDPDTIHAPVIQPWPASGSTLVLSHIAFHAFDDECVDAAPSAGTECQRWRRGKDKRRVLEDSRIGYEQGHWPRWVDAATFTWLRREPNGDVIRFRVELRDAGLTQDWKHHVPMAQLIIEGVVLPPGAP